MTFKILPTSELVRVPVTLPDRPFKPWAPVLVAAFTTNLPLSAPASPSVSFTDTSVGSPTSWSWAFGDGGVSTLQNPGHTYVAPGNYTVTLTVAQGSTTSSVSKIISVQNVGSTVLLDAETWGPGGANDVIKYSGTGVPPALAPADTYSGVTFSSLFKVYPMALSGSLLNRPKPNTLDAAQNDGYFSNDSSVTSIYIPAGLKIVSLRWDRSYETAPGVVFYGVSGSKVYSYVNGTWAAGWTRETINDFFATTGYLTEIRITFGSGGPYYGLDNIILTGEATWTVSEVL